MRAHHILVNPETFVQPRLPRKVTGHRVLGSFPKGQNLWAGARNSNATRTPAAFLERARARPKSRCDSTLNRSGSDRGSGGWIHAILNWSLVMAFMAHGNGAELWRTLAKVSGRKLLTWNTRMWRRISVQAFSWSTRRGRPKSSYRPGAGLWNASSVGLTISPG